jgi:hypothetical protein
MLSSFAEASPSGAFGACPAAALGGTVDGSAVRSRSESRVTSRRRTP